jgi:hypothetical protein
MSSFVNRIFLLKINPVFGLPVNKYLLTKSRFLLHPYLGQRAIYYSTLASAVGCLCGYSQLSYSFLSRLSVPSRLLSVRLGLTLMQCIHIHTHTPLMTDASLRNILMILFCHYFHFTFLLVHHANNAFSACSERSVLFDICQHSLCFPAIFSRVMCC